MAQYTAENIRNIALAGHGSAGKTSLAEALLFKAGATKACNENQPVQRQISGDLV